MSIETLNISQKRYLAGLLELACQQLEITKAQFEDACCKYEAVGKWLERSPDLRLAESVIFPQGSMRLGTTVRPLGGEEFDIDLMCCLRYATAADYPEAVRNIVGRRLYGNDTYRGMLEPLNRGWRLNYAESSKFHLDITPSVDNAACASGGILVPDKSLKQWKPSHPKGYAELFDTIAKLGPAAFTPDTVTIKADIEPLPDQIPIKGLLKRIVQISKRHRDIMFAGDTQKRAPISIIVTTLAAHAYVDALNGSYEHEIDLIYKVIATMNRYIEVREISGKPYYVIPNPTTDGENFAEKWNTHPERAEGFYAWQRQSLQDLNELSKLSGLDAIVGHLKEHLIGPEATRVMNIVTQRMARARSAGLLRTAPAVGLGLNSGQTVRANTFYGK